MRKERKKENKQSPVTSNHPRYKYTREKSEILRKPNHQDIYVYCILVNDKSNCKVEYVGKFEICIYMYITTLYMVRVPDDIV